MQTMKKNEHENAAPVNLADKLIARMRDRFTRSNGQNCGLEQPIAGQARDAAAMARAVLDKVMHMESRTAWADELCPVLEDIRARAEELEAVAEELAAALARAEDECADIIEAAAEADEKWMETHRPLMCATP